MHDDDPSHKEDTAGVWQLITESEVAFRDAMTAFNLMKRRIDDGEFVQPKDVTGLYLQLSQSRSKLINEVREHDKRIARAEGLDDTAPLDLDELRSKIGGRLNRIRDESRSKEFSGDA
ncbi:MAG: hypothetical protein AAGF55_05305 [Pseudomonadota bacterium]